MKCPKCGANLPAGSTSCTKCGARFSVGKRCPYCQTVISASATICPKCGKPQPAASAPKPTSQGNSKGKSNFRWWYIPIMIALVVIGFAGGMAFNPNKEPEIKSPTKNKTTSSTPAKEMVGTNKTGSSDATESEANYDFLTEEEIRQMYSNPEKYKQRLVELSGKVFGNIEYAELGVYFQIYADPVNSDRNTLVCCADKNISIKEGDYVKFKGAVKGAQEGETMIGAKITLPLILTAGVEMLSYQDAVAPTINTITLENGTQSQLGYAVTVQKIELAETETRVYVKVENNGSDKFNLYSFNSKLVQNGKQFEEQRNVSADYPSVQTDLVVGVSTEGIICFPSIENTNFQLIFEGRSENYSEDFEPYTFDIPVE